MLSRLVSLLRQRGYQLLEENESGVYVREGEDRLFMIIISSLESGISPVIYENIRIKKEFRAVSKYQKPVETLLLIVSENNEEGNYVRNLVEHMTNVWVMSLDEAGIYVFENQPGDVGNTGCKTFFFLAFGTCQQYYRYLEHPVFYIYHRYESWV